MTMGGSYPESLGPTKLTGRSAGGCALAYLAALIPSAIRTTTWDSIPGQPW